MNKTLQIIMMIMAGITLLMVAWLSTPSSIFFNPLKLYIKDEKITLVRITLAENTEIEWIGEITLLGRDGFQCHGYGKYITSYEENNIVTRDIGLWAKPCLDQGAPFILRYSYQVIVLGILPLRPVGISTEILGET